MPPARRSRASPPHARRVAPCFYSSPLDAARSKDGAGPRRLMLGTLAACLRFRRPRGRGRRSALLNVGPRLAARRRLPPSRRLTPPGSFRPSSRLRSSGARASLIGQLRLVHLSSHPDIIPATVVSIASSSCATIESSASTPAVPRRRLDRRSSSRSCSERREGSSARGVGTRDR